MSEQSEGRFEGMLASLESSLERFPPEAGKVMLVCAPGFEAMEALEGLAERRGLVLVLSKRVRPGLVFVERNPGLT